MHLMMIFSLLLNIAVLIPVCAGLIFDKAWARSCYGPVTAARSILLSIYGAILVCSILLLLHRSPEAVASLLVVQVLYKIFTPVTVGDISNPVVVSNLAIAAVHTITLTLMWMAGTMIPF